MVPYSIVLAMLKHIYLILSVFIKRLKLPPLSVMFYFTRMFDLDVLGLVGRR